MYKHFFLHIRCDLLDELESYVIPIFVGEFDPKSKLRLLSLSSCTNSAFDKVLTISGKLFFDFHAIYKRNLLIITILLKSTSIP